MAKTLDPIKSHKVEELVECGVSARQAMVKAGYGKGYASTAGAKDEAIHALILKAKERFNRGVIRGFDLVGFTGEEAGIILGTIAKDKDSRSFDRIQAIKVAFGYMSMNLNNVSTATNLNIFIIPKEENGEEWEVKAKKRAIDTSTVESKSEKV